MSSSTLPSKANEQHQFDRIEASVSQNQSLPCETVCESNSENPTTIGTNIAGGKDDEPSDDYEETATTTTSKATTHQSSLDLFTFATPKIPVDTEAKQVCSASKIEELAKNIDKILKIVSTKPSTNDANVSDVPVRNKAPGIDAANLQDFVSANTDFSITEKDGLKILKCKMCAEYLDTSSCSREKSQGDRLPTGSTKGSLCHGLCLEDADYNSYISGKNMKWYRFKKTLVDHMTGKTSKTHLDAVRHHHLQEPLRKREILVVKNQLRAAITVVKTKSAALHYENNIAQLFAAGADVGDYGHSRHMFVPMLKAACAYIDKEVAKFMSTPLPNTGMPPHFYVTGDKSTNHRVTNQVTLICPVVEGRRQAIALNAHRVYQNSDGSGGTGPELAAKLINDVKSHAKIIGRAILAMQGKVTDGQYINEGFITAMNEPLFEELPVDLQDRFWWPMQWDPGHWLDKVFSAYHDGEFVSRLLSRTALIHSQFSHGKMHTVAFETAKELKLPFRTTVPYAKQRFMSSSYKQFLKLESSIEAYINTFRDHDNQELNEYKIAGQDFLFDLLGVIDLLWPLVLLMLRAQLLRCPGWKIASWLPLVKSRMEFFSTQVMEEKPSKSASPRLHQHAEDIARFKYKSIDLVEGWLVESEEQGKPVSWKMREIEDCQNDLKQLAEAMVQTLQERSSVGIPDLLYTLQKCLDFGVLFSSLCGERSIDGKKPVKRADVMLVGQKEFKRCVSFVAKLPHVQELVINEGLELDAPFSDLIFWKLKSFLLEIVWGKELEQFFPKCFKRVSGESLTNVIIPPSQVVTKFMAEQNEFDLLDKFQVTLSSGSSFTVVLQEEEVIQMIYCNPTFIEAVGREFCILFDIFYAKAGTEAIAESFYRVMETQEKDGGQSQEVLTMRTKVDWCLPPLIQCEKSLSSIAELYIKGDKSLGLKRHFIPIYKEKNQSSREMSKVIERLSKEPSRLPFLV